MIFKEDAFKRGIIVENEEQARAVITDESIFVNVVSLEDPFPKVIRGDIELIHKPLVFSGSAFSPNKKDAYTFAEAIDLTKNQIVDPMVEMEVRDRDEEWGIEKLKSIDHRDKFPYTTNLSNVLVVNYEFCRPIKEKNKKYYLKPMWKNSFEEVSEKEYEYVYNWLCEKQNSYRVRGFDGGIISGKIVEEQ